MDKVATETTALSNQMLLASFPSDMLSAIKENVNPCDDFYEFACGSWEDDHKDKIETVCSQTRPFFSFSSHSAPRINVPYLFPAGCLLAGAGTIQIYCNIVCNCVLPLIR